MEVAAVIVVLAAGLGYLNARFLRLPSNSGLTVMGALAALLVIALDRLTPIGDLANALKAFLDRIDFHKTLMEGLLSFLLFAGSLNVDFGHLKRSAGPVLVLSLVGVIASTLVVAAGMRLIALSLGQDASLSWCLVFGALISPTDPVAVLGALSVSRFPPALAATIGGESLFNDGVGVVLFSILLAAAVGGAGAVTPLSALWMFVLEAGGGVALGLASGWIALWMMRTVDDYGLEILITLAVVMGGYALAHRIHVSGPVAMVAAGLLLGNHGVAVAMSETTHDYLIKFWTVVDEVLNAALFLLIGLEAVALTAHLDVVAVALLAIPLVLAARVISIAPAVGAWRRLLPWRLAFPTLTWGGLRGGISIALALALPGSPAKDFLLVATYLVVMFSVIVQGPTIGILLRRLAAATSAGHG